MDEDEVSIFVILLFEVEKSEREHLVFMHGEQLKPVGKRASFTSPRSRCDFSGLIGHGVTARVQLHLFQLGRHVDLMLG